MILFMAGNETIKTSSTNTVCYLAMDDAIKSKFLSEIKPAMEKAQSDFVTLFTTDDADSLSFVRNCWLEAMRL